MHGDSVPAITFLSSPQLTPKRLSISNKEVFYAVGLNTKTTRKTAVKMIEAIIRPYKIDEVKEALVVAGVEGMTITEVKGFGRQKGHHEIYRGSEYAENMLPKLKVEIVAPEDRVKRIVTTIMTAARTGKIGDGRVFVSPRDKVYRIRTEEVDESAI
jgi:nitrogen regulatory protein P-II 1